MRYVMSLGASAAALWTLAAGAGTAHAQFAVGQGPVAERYESLCASCHDGGNGGNLFDGEWKHGDSPEQIAANIKNGITSAGMPAFPTLSDDEVRSLVIYIQERTLLERNAKPVADGSETPDGTYNSEAGAFTVETLHETDGEVWAVETVPGTEGDLLITLKDGRLRHVMPDGTGTDIGGLPQIEEIGQGGLLDVAFHPDFEENGLVYLAFAHIGRREERARFAMTKIIRGRITDDRWSDEETIFEAPADLYINSGAHFGTRITFDGDGHLFFSIGDRGQQDEAQDLARANGKVHRLTLDGDVPEDNPFVSEADAVPSTWSYGNRNPQGLFYDPVRDVLLEVEHGPRGGDELNIIREGRNYGWPVITYGMNYNGTPITGETAREGMEQPVTYWVPSIAVSSIAPYHGDLFAGWQEDVLVGALAAQELRRLSFDGETVTGQEVLLKNRGRVRDLHVADDGRVYLALSYGGRDDRTSRVVVLSPAE